MPTKEQLREKIPSSFILNINGDERRLLSGESILLHSEKSESEDGVDNFAVDVHADHVVFRILFANGVFVTASWGMVKRHLGSPEKTFEIMLTKPNMDGFMAYDELQKTTTGNGWVLEYRPL